LLTLLLLMAAVRVVDDVLQLLSRRPRIGN
jgi:hypothetical protein